MNIQDFLKETLVQISKGVEEAQKELSDSGGRINPSLATQQGTLQNMGELVTKQGKLVYNVEFDIAVSVTDGTDTKAGAGIFVAALAAGAQTADSYKASRVSRIQFKIPITYPEMDA